MTPRVLFNSFDHGHEEDPALAVALTVTVHPSVGPCFTFNGPDGQVEIVGAEAALDVAAALMRWASHPSQLKPITTQVRKLDPALWGAA